MSYLQDAQHYTKNGLSTISTDNTKRSLFPWKPYQSTIATEEQLTTMFEHKKCQGIAVVCGSVSGNLEVIDVDCKYGIDFNAFAMEIKKLNPMLFGKLLIVETKSKGYHLYYKCSTIQGNQKLANRHATAEEIKSNPNIKELVLIETRGEGGYVIAPPSPGYKFIQNRVPQEITPAERDIIINCARLFNEVFEDAKVDVSVEGTNFGLKPWDDYNNRADIVEVLKKHGWAVVEKKGERIYFKRPGATSMTSANFHTGKRIFYVFTTSSQFENKGYAPFAGYALLECNNDCKEATRRVADMGYGERKKIVDKPVVLKVNTMMDQGHQESDILDELIRQYKYSRDEAQLTLKTVKEDNAAIYETFWKVDYNKANIPKISIQKYKLEKFLSTNHFGLYFHDKSSKIYRLIRDEGGFIEEVTSEGIKKFIKGYIQALPSNFDKKGTPKGIGPDELLEVIYKGAESYFSTSFFEFLDHKDLDLLNDTAKECYFPFKNGVVVIDKDKVTLKNYSDIKKSIWASQVNNRHDISIDQDFDPSLCEYYRFLEKISNDDFERLTYAMTLIGYILHRYKDPSKPYAPILAEETDDESKGGGTGKGIFFKAISEMIPTVKIDGRNFKPDRSFAFQRVKLGDNLVVIEDCPRNVDFEKYYPTITEGMTVEKKNKDELFLSYSVSPKIAFTTNYSINNSAEHAKRRQRVFEFAGFFNSKFTPMDFFGHKLFDNWDDDEWNRFYNFMFFCVSLYLKEGILEVNNSNALKRKGIKLNFGEEFLEYYDDLVERASVNYVTMTEEWKSFLARNEMDKKDYSMKRYRKALDTASEAFDYHIDWLTNRHMGNIKQMRFQKAK